MKKSVSIPDELAYKVMDNVYIQRARDPYTTTSFSQVVTDALIFFFQWKPGEVKKKVCKS